MILDSKKFIPEVYSRERDMQVFTTLIDILLTACKYDIDSLYKLYDASICPEQFLPYLADTVNYKYDNSNTVTSNRKIISIFMTMLRYKGSEKGLKIATALSLTTLDLSIKNLEYADVNMDYLLALQDLEIRYNYEEGKIIIDYPNIYTQVRYLLDYVRPVGMYINLRSVLKSPISSAMAIQAQTYTDIHPYSIRDSYVNKAKVNTSAPIDEEKLDALEQLYNNSINGVIDLNNG